MWDGAAESAGALRVRLGRSLNYGWICVLRELVSYSSLARNAMQCNVAIAPPRIAGAGSFLNRVTLVCLLQVADNCTAPLLFVRKLRCVVCVLCSVYIHITYSVEIKLRLNVPNKLCYKANLLEGDNTYLLKYLVDDMCGHIIRV